MIYEIKGNFKNYLLGFKVGLYLIIGVGVLFAGLALNHSGIVNALITLLFSVLFLIMFQLAARSILKIKKVVRIEFLPEKRVKVEYFTDSSKLKTQNLTLDNLNVNYKVLIGARVVNSKLEIYNKEDLYVFFENSDLWERNQLESLNLKIKG